MITPEMETVRPFVEAEIERLIEILDTLESDPDFEEGHDDEPWLGAPESRFRFGGGTEWSNLSSKANDDREDDGDDLEPCYEDEGGQCDDEGSDSGDAEMTLGAPNDRAGSWFGCGNNYDEDGEMDDCDLEDGHDAEAWYEGQRCPAGPCSPIETMLGQR